MQWLASIPMLLKMIITRLPLAHENALSDISTPVRPMGHFKQYELQLFMVEVHWRTCVASRQLWHLTINSNGILKCIVSIHRAT